MSRRQDEVRFRTHAAVSGLYSPSVRYLALGEGPLVAPASLESRGPGVRSHDSGKGGGSSMADAAKMTPRLRRFRVWKSVGGALGRQLVGGGFLLGSRWVFCVRLVGHVGISAKRNGREFSQYLTFRKMFWNCSRQ